MSFPRYESYKDSGVEWLGDVPASWRIVLLKRVATIRYGIGEPPKYMETGIPLIRATDVDAGQIKPDGLVFVDPCDIPASRIVWLSSGDIIVVRSGAYTGDSATIRSRHCPCIAGFDMVVTAFGCSPDFLQYALLSSYLKNYQIDLEKMRAAQPHLNAEELGSCFVILPPPTEQSAIVAFLDRERAKVDALVEEQQRLIELLKEKRQAVISNAVTKGLDPNVSMKHLGGEWLDQAPDHWKVVRIKHVTRSIEQGWSPQCEGSRVGSSDEWGVLKVGCVNGGTFIPSENKALPLDLEPIPELGIAAGDLLVSRANTRELVGSAAVASAAHPNLLLCDKLYRLRLDPSACSPVFLASYLGTSQVRGQIELAATGASSSMLNIGQSTILDLPVALPPVQEQSSIISFLQSETAKLDALMAEAEAAIALLQERRSALISCTVSGQIDVRGLVPARAEAA